MPHARPSSSFAARVYQVVGAIPRGRVMTYGQIAALIPPPSGVDLRGYELVKARWVGYAMAECPEGFPWQRVINGRGRISRRGGEGPELQRLLLTEEGVVFDETGRVELARYAWEPGPEWHAAHPGFLPPPGRHTPGPDHKPRLSAREEKMDAIIVAGGIPGPEDPLYPLTQGRPKALLDLEGQPMLQWVVDALEAASRVERVFVLFPGPESSIRLGPRSTYLPDQGGMIANIQAGLRAVQEAKPAATHALLSSGDIPGITPEMVDWRVQTVAASDADLDYAVVERTVMDRVFPGSRRSFTPLKGIEVCGGDLNGLRLSVASDARLWNNLYASRKNALKQASLLGFDLFLLAALRRLTLEDAARRGGRRLGLKAHVTLCPYAEIGMDVDKPHQLEMVRLRLRARATA